MASVTGLDVDFGTLEDNTLFFGDEDEQEKARDILRLVIRRYIEQMGLPPLPPGGWEARHTFDGPVHFLDHKGNAWVIVHVEAHSAYTSVYLHPRKRITFA